MGEQSTEFGDRRVILALAPANAAGGVLGFFEPA